MKLIIKKYTFYILIIFAMFLLSNCSNKNKEISISNIDSTLIGKTVTESQLWVKYNPPQMWISANEGLHRPPDRKIKYGAATFSPINLFYNAGNKAVLNLGEIIPRNSVSNFDLEKYIFQSTKKFETGKIDKDKFSNNGIDFMRFRINYGVWFTYRLIFRNKSGKYIQFDYSLQSKFLKNEISAIKSSIGSIKLM